MKKQVVFACDIGGSKLLCGFVDEDGDIIDTEKVFVDIYAYNKITYDAYDGCNLLKNVVYPLNSIYQFPSNVETYYIKNILDLKIA